MVIVNLAVQFIMMATQLNIHFINHSTHRSVKYHSTHRSVKFIYFNVTIPPNHHVLCQTQFKSWSKSDNIDLDVTHRQGLSSMDGCIIKYGWYI